MDKNLISDVFNSVKDYIDGEKNKIRCYKSILIYRRSKTLPKLKPKVRCKKCRGYYRKLYQSLMAILYEYQSTYSVLHEYYHMIEDKIEANEFFDKSVRCLEKNTLELHIKLIKMVVNNEIKIKCRSISNNQFRSISIFMRLDKEKFIYEIDLESLDYIKNTKFNLFNKFNYSY